MALKAISSIQAVELQQIPSLQTTESSGISETVGYSLWNKFVHWCHCNDIPLVYGAYAINRKYPRVSYVNNERRITISSVIEFMMGDADRKVSIDRVCNDKLLSQAEKLRKHSQELLDEEVVAPPLPEDFDGRLVPQEWFVEKDSNTGLEEVGVHMVLTMPPASEEKKKRWEDRESDKGKKRKRTSYERDLDYAKKLSNEYVAKQFSFCAMLNEACENVKTNELEANIALLKKMMTAAKEMKRKYTAYAKQKSVVDAAPDREMTEDGSPSDEPEEEEEESSPQ